MKLATRSGKYTFDEFCFLVKDGQKADLIDGVIYMASPDNSEHDELIVWLMRLLGDFVDVFDLGRISGSRRAYRLGDRNSPEPDISFVRKERLHLSRKGFFDGSPDLALEIVSQESVDRDYHQKRLQYEQAGISEYWIIDEEQKKVTLLRLDTKGKYREVRPRKGVLHSQVLPGFWIRVNWLWTETRPRKADALAQILA
jgi:Uma2 family endonuclease